ncbi:RNA polymerase sigma-70 factor, ECF subfamily [Filimonas lacunae]|uniref:RNA polymerase sigma-70 factor, ECF subfamily n=1 Tax=Filimonas lacunae TaxID=477680 RepID=A0A173MBR5_9BACT|nr:RNA polymerase sigma-70 factor [Filimonas lacunae]BAV04977.1 RNA polymerase ECF-type sigma factor [Filimonas lacunae]SIT33708.1 RNA polymerase sigma-70 factor, ECF subfamily [Filimonas lacunae]
MEYQLWSDKELLAACAQDRIQAFNVLFDRYSGKLYQYALSYVKDEHMAEEAMMDVLLWIWNKRQELSIEGEFNSYVFRAVKNATIKVLRKKALAAASMEEVENDARFATEHADQLLQHKELEQQYINSLSQLSPQRRLVFAMSREGNLSHAEIASKLDLSVNTVKNHIKASLSHFREQMDQYSHILLPLGMLLLLR